MTYRSAGGLRLDVLCASRHASQDGGHEVVAGLQSVVVREGAPAATHVAEIAVWRRLDERPAEVGDVLDSSTRSCLLPVDETDWHPVLNDHVPGLQIVVDHALVSGHEAGGQIVEAPYHPGERRQVDLVTRRGGHTGDPREDLIALVVDTERSGSPRHARVLEMPQNPVHQSRIRTGRTPHRVADTHRATHCLSVADRHSVDARVTEQGVG